MAGGAGFSPGGRAGPFPASAPRAGAGPAAGLECAVPLCSPQRRGAGAGTGDEPGLAAPGWEGVFRATFWRLLRGRGGGERPGCGGGRNRNEITRGNG